MKHLAAASIAALLLARARPASADVQPLPLCPGPPGHRFITLLDDGRFEHADWNDKTTGDQLLWSLLLDVYDRAAIDPALAVIVTTFSVPPLGQFYWPLANDVRGLGYRHGPLGETFDRSPGHASEGLVYLDAVDPWLADAAAFRSIFCQEIGHRWGATAHADLGEGETDELLGRERAHWSYFLDTGGSAMEGNRWIDAGGGRFTTATRPDEVVYFGFDLYAMGLVPPSEVPATFLLRADVPPGTLDCLGAPVTRSSPPQRCAPVTLPATSVPVTIDDVIAIEGLREPAWPDTPRSFDTAFVLIARQADLDARPELIAAVDGLVDTAVTAFAAATGGRGTLRVASEDQAPRPCDDAAGCGCAVGRAVTPAATPLPFLLTAWRRRRARASPARRRPPPAR